VIGVFWVGGLTHAAPLPPMKSYRVNIVSPPPVAVGPPRREVTPPPEPEPAQREPEPEPDPDPVVEQPPETPPVIETKPAPKPPAPKPPAEREPERKPPEPEPKRPTPAAQPATGAEPKPNTARSGSGLNIQIEGDLFPFPGYLEHITEQVSRYFRWTGASGLKAELYFEIMRDGSVQGIRLLTGSGNVAFNIEAMSAIEQAGNRRAFGPLPDGYTGDRLPVSFYFQPAR
jgi:outer membrane biosynthesis protein TonB